MNLFNLYLDELPENGSSQMKNIFGNNEIKNILLSKVSHLPTDALFITLGKV
jgi:hypothetical protein